MSTEFTQIMGEWNEYFVYESLLSIIRGFNIQSQEMNYASTQKAQISLVITDNLYSISSPSSSKDVLSSFS